MKRMVVLFVVLTVVAGGAFGIEFWFGPNAYYSELLEPADVRNADTSELKISDFSYGAELRTYIGLFTASAVGVYLPGGALEVDRMLVMTDFGVNVKLLFLRAGISIGPDFGIAFEEAGAVGGRSGGNLRLTGDIVLGNLSLGLAWVNRIALTAEGVAGATRETEGYLGITVLGRL